nr:glutaredoxin family protein [Vibrio sp. S11_S32]
MYSTSGCHLCEMAFKQLQQLNLTDNVRVVDIAFDDDLFARYGVTIPVLTINLATDLEAVLETNVDTINPDTMNQNSASQATQVNELFWPFNIEELQVWLKQNGINYHP